jgi:ribose transport system substrate-binding protein
MNRRTITAAFGVIVVAVAISGCNRAENASNATTKQPYVALISKGFRHQFWQAVKQGAEQAGKDFNVKVTFEGAQEEGNVEQQIQLLQTTLDKHPDAIGFAAIDSQAAGPLMQQAKTDHIPVIAFDSGVDSDVPVCTASTDNLAAAAEAAKHMADQIGHEGKIAMVVHDQTSVTGVQRRDGFVNYLKEHEPKITVVDIQYSGDPLKATDLAKAMIAAHPDLKGMYGSNEGAAIGVVHAVQELGIQGKLKVVGFDSGKDQIDAIKSGLMAGAITQNPVGIGYETVKAAVAVIKGQTVAKNIDTGFYWYDKTNVDDPKIAGDLYQ